MLKRRGIKHELLNAKPENVGPRGRDRRPGRAASAPSPSPPTWPAAAPTSSSAAIPRRWPGRSSSNSSTPTPAALPDAPRRARGRLGEDRSTRSRAKEKMKEEGRKVAEMGGLHIVGTERHETPAHRQPAARPGRPAGRSRLAPLLPVAARRPDAHLRRRVGGRRAHPARHEGRRGHREPAWSPGASRRPRRRSRNATSTTARTCSNTTR